MKILFVNEYIYPNVVSGAEFSMQTLAEALKEQGQEVFFFGPNLSRQKVNKYKGMKILRFPFFKKEKPGKSLSPIWFNNPIFWFYSTLFLFFVCLKRKIDIIHLHGKYLLPAAIATKFFLKVPVVVTVRDYKFLCPLALCLIKQEKVCHWRYFLFEEIKFYLSKYEKNKKFLGKCFLVFRILIAKTLQRGLFGFLKSADKVFCVSQAVLEIYKKAGVDKGKLFKIYNLPPEIAKKEKSKRGKKTVLYVGKLSFGKGTDLLIKAVNRLREQMPQIRLILVGGKSPSIDPLPEFVEHHKEIPHNRIGQFYKKASLFVLPSRWPEPLSRATLEALSFGLPLVLSNKGGNREVVEDGVNGYLVSLNTGELAERILVVLNDEKKAKKMGEASIKILKERFNRGEIINEHLELYKDYIVNKG